MLLLGINKILSKEYRISIILSRGFIQNSLNSFSINNIIISS